MIDVHRGTSAFNKGVEIGDKIGQVEPGNGGYELTLDRGSKVYQVFVKSSGLAFVDRINHKQLEDQISSAAKSRIKKLSFLRMDTASLSKTVVLDAIDGVHMGALRRTNDTPIIEKQTMEGLRWIPEHAREIVWDAGIRVLATPSILDLDESFKTAQPRGIHGGYTAIAGLYMGASNIMAVSERVQYRNNPPQIIDSREIICHELATLSTIV